MSGRRAGCSSLTRWSMVAAAFLFVFALLAPGHASAASETGLAAGPAPVRSEAEGEAFGDKVIEINLSQQLLTAWEGDTVVWSTYISSGRDPYFTPTGTYAIFYKLLAQDMSGPDPNFAGGRYFQPEVPWVMYFAPEYAIHGVYWHSNFGTPSSHGCVGAPLGGAAFLYEWAPLGTPVIIYY